MTLFDESLAKLDALISRLSPAAPKTAPVAAASPPAPSAKPDEKPATKEGAKEKGKEKDKEKAKDAADADGTTKEKAKKDRGDPEKIKAAKEAKELAAAAAAASGAPPPPPADPSSAKAPKDPKPKPEKKADAAEKPPADPAELFARCQLLVGHVVAARDHPEAERLCVETIDCGEAAPRTIVSGVRGRIPLEKLVGARVVVAANLPPRKLVGIESQGMLLCAHSAGGEHIELVEPPAGTPAGTRLEVEGAAPLAAPDLPTLRPKDKVWEAVAPGLRLDASGRLCHVGRLLGCGTHGACRAATLTDAVVS